MLSVADTSQAYLYRSAMDHCRELWARTPGVSLEMAKTCGLHGLRVAGNNGVTKTKGKELARAQGGWTAKGSQGRYDRWDMAEVAQIPAAIVSSWDARADPDPVFQVQPAPTRPAPAAISASPPPPVERSIVQLPAAVRNLRRSGAGRSSVGGSAAPAPAAATPRCLKRPRASSAPPREPASAPPAVQAAVAPPRRDSASSLLSLTRPVRRASAICRLPASIPGTWRSGAA